METTRHPCYLSFVVIKDSRCYVNGKPDQGFDIPQRVPLRTIADCLIDYCKQQGIAIGGDPPDNNNDGKKCCQRREGSHTRVAFLCSSLHDDASYYCCSSRNDHLSQ